MVALFPVAAWSLQVSWHLLLLPLDSCPAPLSIRGPARVQDITTDWLRFGSFVALPQCEAVGL